MMETDAPSIEEYSAPLTAYRRMCELARTLERERDEALELIDAVTPEIDAAYMTDLCCTLRSERDEAMERADTMMRTQTVVDAHKCPKHGKLEKARIKDVRFGDDMTATIYITYCPTCRQKHDVSFSS
jgi:chromatin segregation and condensation protein Rec8/ScpA/Scc1 (kleisin family)